MESTPIISKEDMAKLLGRPLTSAETTNYDLYIEIAQEQLEQLLGLKLTGTDNSERVYEARSGFHSLVIDPFSANNPTVTDGDGNAVTGFAVRLDDDYNAKWFNTIELVDRMKAGIYKVKAKWGYGSELPKGLQLLMAGMFDVTANGNPVASEAKIKSETTLSHSVTFDTSSEAYQRFVDSYAALIAKYSQDRTAMVLSGKVRHPAQGVVR